MRTKVTLKEILGTKIIYAGLIAAYYWMWARTDWKGYYEVIQNSIVIFTIVFFILMACRKAKYHKEEFDELAISNLKRCDALCLKMAMMIMVLVAFLGALNVVDGVIMGYILVNAIIVLSLIRTIIFSVMDSKGV